MNGLQGKVALVTRDGNGLAEAVAEALATAGAAVALGGSDDLPLDPADEASCRDALAAVEARHGRLDALCNLAAAAPALRPLHEVPEAEWYTAVLGTLRSTLLVSRFALPLLRRSAGRRRHDGVEVRRRSGRLTRGSPRRRRSPGRSSSSRWTDSPSASPGTS